MIRLILLFILTFTFLSQSSAQTPSKLERQVNLNWELVPDSIGYQIELKPIVSVGGSKIRLIKTMQNSWSGSVAPGKYQMRIRSIDDREVFGEWSDSTELAVRISQPVLQLPQDQSVIKAVGKDEGKVTFQWNEVPGATSYRLEVLDDTGQLVADRIVDKTNFELPLALAKNYQWKVTSLFQDQADLGNPCEKNFAFALKGPAVSTPSLEKPASKFATELRWDPVTNAKEYQYDLLRKNETGKWTVVAKEQKTFETKITLNPTAPGGQYRLIVKALGENRDDSRKVYVDFKLYDGDRSPAAVESAMLRDAIEIEKSKYWIASYYISNLSYTGTNRESGTASSTTMIGGTGRLGYGYMPKGKWGYVTLLDMSGVTIENQNYVYGALEFEVMYRHYLNSTTQMRYYAGLAINDVPEAKTSLGKSTEVQNITQLGPLAGIQLWKPLNSRWGVQFNSQVSTGLIKLRTPNSNAIVPTLSYQAGILGSYKLRDSATALAGYAFRNVQAAYKATPYTGGSTANFAKDGDVNEVQLSGHFLNLYLEWGF